MLEAGHSGNRISVYIDFDSCYYNVARKLYRVVPWTIITNRFNHIISAPRWLEGHFGVKKITYLAPPVKVRLKTNCFIRILNIDRIPDGRKTMTEFIANILENVKPLTYNASVVHKDSIVAEVECSQVGILRDIVGLPCTIGTGQSEEEAKSDCKVKKLAKKRDIVNAILFMFYVAPMITSYALSNNKEV